MNRPLKVLLVEDLEAMQKYVTETIAKLDPVISFVPAKSLNEAIRVLQESDIDVVLLDLLLPDAENLQALLTLREMNPLIPIVVMTGLGGLHEGDALQAGAQDFLEKDPGLKSKTIVRALRHSVLRHEFWYKYAKVTESMRNTKRALDTASSIEKQVDECGSRSPHKQCGV